MLQIMCVNALLLSIHVVELRIHVPMAFVNVALRMLAVYQGKHVSQELVSAEQRILVLEWLLVLIATLQIMYANAQQQWMLAVEQPILVLVEFVNVAQMMPAVTLEKLVAQELASVELPIAVLVK